MIKLTKLNRETLYVNPFVIESIELTPDTVIYLTNGKTIIVRDSIEYIVREFSDFYKNFNILPLDSAEKFSKK